MSHIFLSYCAEDRERVRPLVPLLSEVAPVWWDQSIHHGENWEIAVETAVEEAACIVVAWTRESVKSNWVRSEAGDARDRSILVPVLLDDVKPPLAFRHIQTAQLQGWDGDPEHPQAQALKEAVTGLVARAAASPPAMAPTALRPPATPAPGAGQPPRRRGGWLGKPGEQMALLGLVSIVPFALFLVGYLILRPSPDKGPPHGPNAKVTASPLESPSGPAATPAPTASPSESSKIRPSPTANPSPTIVPTPTPVVDRSIWVKDTATADLSAALAAPVFHYLVDRNGKVFTGIRAGPGEQAAGADTRLTIGVVHASPSMAESKGFPYEPYTDEQITALVALLTTVAHQRGVNLGAIRFGRPEPEVNELTKRAEDVESRVAKLLTEWRASGTKPAAAQVILVSPSKEPPP